MDGPSCFAVQYAERVSNGPACFMAKWHAENTDGLELVRASTSGAYPPPPLSGHFFVPSGV